jgi:hypothetical protein
MDIRTTGTSKRTLAKEAWKPLARFFFETAKHRQRVFADSGLTPNDARALVVLDRTRGRSMSELADEWLCDARTRRGSSTGSRARPRGTKDDPHRPTGQARAPHRERGQTRHEMIRSLYEPPPELLELDLKELEALRDAVAKLPLHGTS